MYYFLKSLADPYALVVLLLGVTILIGWIRSSEKRWSLRIAFALWIGLYAFSLPSVGDGLMRTLTGWYELDPDLDSAPVIVVLGGGVVPPEDENGPTQLTISSFQRCVHAISALRKNPTAKILCCGGKVHKQPGLTEAATMAAMLQRAGVPRSRLLLETKSRSTSQSANRALELLSKLQINEIILVTHSRHLPRAVGCYEKVGFKVIPYGCGPHGSSGARFWYQHAIPSVPAMESSRTALREWLGIAWYWVTGKV